MKIIVFVIVCLSMAVAARAGDEKRILIDLNRLIHSKYLTMLHHYGFGSGLG